MLPIPCYKGATVVINNFDIDWWAFLLIGLAAGMSWWLVLPLASIFAIFTRHFHVEDRYSPIRAYGNPHKAQKK